MAVQPRGEGSRARRKRTGRAMPHRGTPLAYAEQAKETNSFLLEKGQTVQPRRLVFFFLGFRKWTGRGERRTVVGRS